ncbi:carbohydrate sulfotransferase 1-like [Panulirus ornatus]|uniref:carbohydrate sulfotransferase 1-like n=1 Tax=Panulirus ornatus TaxID=150431 RepID=UPI003A89F43E
MRRRLSTIIVVCLMCVSLMLTYVIHKSANPRDHSQRPRLLEPSGFVHEKRSEQGHRAQPEVTPDGRTNILIMSSLGRSGSSFLADLVASQGSNIYFFEPVRPVKMINATRDLAVAEIARYFNCTVREDLFSRRNGNKTIRLRATSKCNDGVSLTKNETAARITCQQQKVVIVKTIRLRLSWARELMDDEHLHLKLIHLVRDPRAIMLSMSDSKWGKIDENNVCPFMLQDLQYKQEMERLFPDRYFFLRYEDLCTNLEEEARRIFRFVGLLNNSIAIKG